MVKPGAFTLFLATTLLISGFAYQFCSPLPKNAHANEHGNQVNLNQLKQATIQLDKTLQKQLNNPGHKLHLRFVLSPELAMQYWQAKAELGTAEFQARHGLRQSPMAGAFELSTKQTQKLLNGEVLQVPTSGPHGQVHMTYAVTSQQDDTQSLLINRDFFINPQTNYLLSTNESATTYASAAQ